MTVPTVEIDFEVYSEVSISDVGLYNYARHHSTQIICMAYSINGGEVQLWVPGNEHDIPPEYRLVAHNAAFEYELILTLGWTLGLGLPHGLVCTAAQAAAMSLPRSLSGASKALILEEEKDETGKRVMLQVTQPRKPSKTNPSTNWFFDEDKMRTVYEYCIQDVKVEQAIRHNTFELRPNWERQVYEMDLEINRRGIPVDMELVEGAIECAAHFSALLDAEIRDLTDGAVDSVHATAQLRDYMAKQGYPVKSVAKDVLPDLLNQGLPHPLHRIIECRKEGALSSIAKYEKIRAWTGDGWLRHILMYHGAHTGRWTGKGPQLHNLPRGEYKGDKGPLIRALIDRDLEAIQELGDAQGLAPLDCISSCVRETFKALPGHTFIAGDYAGIELRVLAWLAGDLELVARLEAGEDLYVSMAARIYCVEESEVTSNQRLLGKMAILGLGYQMGPAKFRDQCKAQAGIELDLDEAKRIVEIYRTSFPKITDFWRDIEKAFLRAIDGKPQTIGPIQIICHGDLLVAILPSGRPIYYPGAKIVKGRFGNDQPAYLKALGDNMVENQLYGGLITENLVQAIARDLLAQAMLRLHWAGFEICLHVHDEVVLHVLEQDSITIEKKFVAALLQRERWSEGIPLAVETWIGERYHK